MISGRSKAFVILVAVLALLLGCAVGTSRWLRRHGYPPSFEFLAKKEVGSAMRTLALVSHGLDRELREGDRTGSYRQEAIVRWLGDMEKTGETLAAGKWPSDHPMLWSRIGLFYDDIRAARRMASAVPPSYVLAGTVSGACVYCHSDRVERSGAD